VGHPNPGGKAETQKWQNQVIMAQKVPKNGQKCMVFLFTHPLTIKRLSCSFIDIYMCFSA
jgi:hypothetical protein